MLFVTEQYQGPSPLNLHIIPAFLIKHHKLLSSFKSVQLFIDSIKSQATKFIIYSSMFFIHICSALSYFVLCCNKLPFSMKCVFFSRLNHHFFRNVF